MNWEHSKYVWCGGFSGFLHSNISSLEVGKYDYQMYWFSKMEGWSFVYWLLWMRQSVCNKLSGDINREPVKQTLISMRGSRSLSFPFIKHRLQKEKKEFITRESRKYTVSHFCFIKVLFLCQGSTFSGWLQYHKHFNKIKHVSLCCPTSKGGCREWRIFGVIQPPVWLFKAETCPKISPMLSITSKIIFVEII